jgi:hypothetical protein
MIRFVIIVVVCFVFSRVVGHMIIEYVCILQEGIPIHCHSTGTSLEQDLALLVV